MIYRFRIILDNNINEDVFRDLEIKETDKLEDLHNAILNAFGLEGKEMASFYISDEDWSQGEEIPLFNMQEGNAIVKNMANTNINDVVHEASPKLIYIYDFLNMWTFYVELAEIVDAAAGKSYPNLLFAHGQLPDEAPYKTFESIEDVSEQDFDEDFGDFDLNDLIN